MSRLNVYIHDPDGFPATSKKYIFYPLPFPLYHIHDDSKTWLNLCINLNCFYSQKKANNNNKKVASYKQVNFVKLFV